MSASSLQRILDAAAPQIEQACREGRGEELLLDFHRSVAVDFADSCFLKMDAEVTAATEETVAGVYEWLQVFPTVAINDLAECVRSTYAAYKAYPSLEAERAEKVACEAFAERLSTLFDTVDVGGSA